MGMRMSPRGRSSLTAHISWVFEDFTHRDATWYSIIHQMRRRAAAVKALNDAGTAIVISDSAVSDLSKVNCFVVSDSYSCGQIAGEELIKKGPEGGKVAVLDFPGISSSC